MNPYSWIQTFEGNRGTFAEPTFESHLITLPEEMRRPLARSLAIFQLGESGGGTRLLRYVRQVIPERQLTGYEEAVKLFVAEEQYHAALLGKLVVYLKGDLLEKQWSNGVFRWVRNALGLEFNIQILLTAELIAEAYYGLLYRKVPDEVVKTCCRKILKDEMRHIGFHNDFFREVLGTWPFAKRWLWGRQFAFCLEATLQVVAWDHGHALRAIGTTQEEFRRQARKAGKKFLRRLSWHPGKAVTHGSRKSLQLAPPR